MVTFQIATFFTILHFITGDGTSVVQLHIHHQLFTVLIVQHSHHIHARNPRILIHFNGKVC